jgi:hypothetical protein
VRAKANSVAPARKVPHFSIIGSELEQFRMTRIETIHIFDAIDAGNAFREGAKDRNHIEELIGEGDPVRLIRPRCAHDSLLRNSRKGCGIPVALTADLLPCDAELGLLKSIRHTKSERTRCAARCSITRRVISVRSQHRVSRPSYESRCAAAAQFSPPSAVIEQLRHQLVAPP